MDLTEYNEIMDMISLYGKAKDESGFHWGKDSDKYSKADAETLELYGKLSLRIIDLVSRYQEAKEELKKVLDKQK